MQKKLISLTKRQVAWLRGQSKRLGVSVSELIRRTLDARIEKGEL